MGRVELLEEHHLCVSNLVTTVNVVLHRHIDMFLNHSSFPSHTASPWTLSFWDRDASMAVTPDGLRCQSRAPNWQGCRAAKAVQSSGKYYYEATVTDEGLCRVGWSTSMVNYW